MNEELDQIEKNDTWELVPQPKDKNVIGTKWVFKNKLNEDRQVTGNKARLVCKGYAQVEGINFEEIFGLIARMEAIRMFLAYTCSRKIKVYQMDVKSAFLNGEFEEEVYIEQPEGFLLTDQENYVCRLKKAIYGLEQAPRAWYDRLDRYIHQQGFKKGSADNNLYVKVDQDNLTIIEAVGQVARFQAAPKESHIISVKRILRYLKGTTEYGLWYPKGNDLVIQAYTNADWVGSVDDQYIAAATCCTQVLWKKQTLQDLQVKFDEPIPIFCDNTSAISISKNLVMHSKMKCILIKYHFVRDQVAERNIKLEYVGTKEQIANIFTKPLPREAFEYLRQKLGILRSFH
eukprot:PITA_14802